MSAWTETLYRLVERASTDLPADVEAALRRSRAAEIPGSTAAAALATLLDNVALARQRRQPLCQDTGTLLFWVAAPCGSLSQAEFRAAAEDAVARATRDGILRPNAVDAVSGRNSGTNVGTGSPSIHWEETPGANVRVHLMLKGGGCENVGTQYALPDARLAADRDLEGVRRCLLHAVQSAQGMGCAPGILGVAIGGDRATGFLESKRQLLRPLGQPSPVPALAALETRVCTEANTLGIGPMGFGGRTTLLGVAIGALHRVPASYFVSVSYMCWACRRHGLEATPSGHFQAWR